MKLNVALNAKNERSERKKKKKSVAYPPHNLNIIPEIAPIKQYAEDDDDDNDEKWLPFNIVRFFLAVVSSAFACPKQNFLILFPIFLHRRRQTILPPFTQAMMRYKAENECFFRARRHLCPKQKQHFPRWRQARATSTTPTTPSSGDGNPITISFLLIL